MNSLISLRRATKNDLKFLELIYNDKTHFKNGQVIEI